MSAARKKDLQRAKEEIRKEEQRRHKDKVMDDSRKEWAKILPKWESMYVSFLFMSGVISHPSSSYVFVGALAIFSPLKQNSPVCEIINYYIFF